MSEFLGHPVSSFPEGTRTAADAAAAIGCEVAQIVKSLVFRRATGKALIVLASGGNRVDEAKLEEQRLVRGRIDAHVRTIGRSRRCPAERARSL